MDVHDKLDELTALVESARSMPMSASCVLNRGEVLALLEELRELLPEEFRHAQLLLQDREAVLEEGRREVARMLDLARDERDVLVANSQVLLEAARQAEEMRAAVYQEAEVLRAQVDDYVDTKLANFEVVLDKTLTAVQRGREKLSSGRTSQGDFAGPPAEQPVSDAPFDDGVPPAWTI